MKASTRESLTAFWFLFPFLLGTLVFFAFAFLRTLWFSLTNYNLFEKNEFVGLQNFANIPGDSLFVSALINTFSFAIFTTLIQTIGALVLAVIMNQKLRGISFFRTAYYFPSIASSAVTTLIFLWLFRPTGLISFMFTQLQNALPLILTVLAITVVAQFVQVRLERARGLPASPFDPALLFVSLLIGILAAVAMNAFGVIRLGVAEVQPLDWFSRPDKFLGFISYPILMIILMNSFTTMPTLMLIFLAGLQGISKTLYEAASVDGATPLQQMLYITIPVLRPITFFVITLGIIGTLQMFDQASIMGAVVPLDKVITLAYYVYNNVFTGGAEAKVGLACAGALILALLTLGVLQLQRRFFVSEEGAS
jgi:multiple sugar transport system permease protein